MSNYAKRCKERPQKHGNFTTFSYLNNLSLLSLLLCNVFNSGGHRHDDLIQISEMTGNSTFPHCEKKTSKNRWFPNSYLFHKPSNTKAPFSAPCPESLRSAILHSDTCFHYFVGGRSCLLVENLFLQPTAVVKIQNSESKRTSSLEVLLGQEFLNACHAACHRPPCPKSIQRSNHYILSCAVPHQDCLALCHSAPETIGGSTGLPVSVLGAQDGSLAHCCAAEWPHRPHGKLFCEDYGHPHSEPIISRWCLQSLATLAHPIAQTIQKRPRHLWNGRSTPAGWQGHRPWKVQPLTRPKEPLEDSWSL